ncbi:ChbG/HpnK family deacetylase [Paenibacillus frigoriresistens]|uniref:ChbG/HpnK family deacetylase n=1 Tax=Paenibacillus alginolyticus TaxID=59839 RepID=UPI001565D24E|nr:ChbG/HpnK family deacetylase [Paenibacillus frigoriresistens]NRF96249.1 ChbG/HpnK family deacetylase [Paenibacillus frigoriresistens]
MNLKLGFEGSDRILIINADDFGITEGTNEAILALFQHAAITSTSIMIPCPATRGVLNKGDIKNIEKAGIHLTLSSTENQGLKPVYHEDKLYSLVNSDNEFFTDIAYIEPNADLDEVRLELQAQIKYAISKGINPTHLDSHAGSIMGLCTGRDFLEIALDLCQEYQLPFNLPRRILIQPFINEKQRERFSARISSAERRGILLIDDMISLPYCLSINAKYDTVKAQFITMIENLKPGITQLTVHPSIITEDLKRLTSCYVEREIEFRLLCDLDIMQLLKKENIKLVSWKDIRDIQRYRGER